MRSTSQGWKDNQAAQLRSKSLIKLVFNDYAPLTNITYTTEDEDDDRIPYLKIDNETKLAGIISLGDETWTDIAKLSFTVNEVGTFVSTLVVDLSMNVNVKINLYTGSTISQTLTYNNTSHIQVI